jgi:nitronate monooxygenase
MFLVSNTKMVIEGMKGCGCIPALNYRTLEELRALSNLEAKVPGGSFGYNLIVNKSNIKYKDQLAVLCAEKVDFITPLGSPEETIKAAHKVGIKVFVMLPTFAKKVESLGADALIAVNNLAGGHREILLLKH